MSTDTLDLKGIAELMNLGVDATRELIERGEVPVVSHNQKHTCAVRDQILDYLRETAVEQAAERKREWEKRQAMRKGNATPPATPAPARRGARRAAPANLDGYPVTKAG